MVFDSSTCKASSTTFTLRQSAKQRIRVSLKNPRQPPPPNNKKGRARRQAETRPIPFSNDENLHQSRSIARGLESARQPKNSHPFKLSDHPAGGGGGLQLDGHNHLPVASSRFRARSAGRQGACRQGIPRPRIRLGRQRHADQILGWSDSPQSRHSASLGACRGRSRQQAGLWSKRTGLGKFTP